MGSGPSYSLCSLVHTIERKVVKKVGTLTFFKNLFFNFLYVQLTVGEYYWLGLFFPVGKKASVGLFEQM